jgi:hypothetical protein
MALLNPHIRAIKGNLKARYTQKIKDELPQDEEVYRLAFVVIDVLLELVTEMLAEYDKALRKSIDDKRTFKGPAS